MDIDMTYAISYIFKYNHPMKRKSTLLLLYIVTNSLVAQGVQQPFEISVVTGIPEAEGINLTISVYPNPANDFLILKIDANVQTRHALSQIVYELYDINGKLLKSKNITADKTEIATNDLTPATYFLKVTDNKKVIKSFKIIKK